MAYTPIENYGIIGNMRSAALISTHASIDWFCFPHFDSPSVFARILDDRKGGFFQIAPINEQLRAKQYYFPDTNVLITRFFGEEGIVEVTDFMPVGSQVKDIEDYRIIRMVKGIHGCIRMRMTCAPAFHYALQEHETTLTAQGATFVSPDLSLALSSTHPLELDQGAAMAEFDIPEEQTAVFVLHVSASTEGANPVYNASTAETAFKATITYWRKWLSQSTYKGRWREMVNRSALVLKLLTFEPTGAIVAAPTCALPEDLGGERNWDYRYTWIRDAAFTVYAFMRIGFTEEAARFMEWVFERSQESDEEGRLQIMYAIDGHHELEEKTLDHLDGYQGSKPVRIGNGAYDQLQLDIYGELMDSVYLYNKYGQPISFQAWQGIRTHIEYVIKHWRETDMGIWEVRGGKQHFVYSKMMCWVALDRAIRLAEKRSFPADVERWRKERDEIYLEIMEKGFDPTRKAFVQAYGRPALDASNLMMPLVFFIAPNDPMMLSTLEATLKPPSQGGLVSNSLVYRYNLDETEDGLSGEEGTFNICTFWLVEAMTRAGKSHPEWLDEARLMFERMLGYANHLGLYSEEIGLNGEALGNTPQAFTHLALISAAYNLNRSLG